MGTWAHDENATRDTDWVNHAVAPRVAGRINGVPIYEVPSVAFRALSDSPCQPTTWNSVVQAELLKGPRIKKVEL